MAVLFLLRLLLCSFVIRAADTAIKLLSAPGARTEFPCKYIYEDQGAIREMSLQWRGPDHQLLCHYIKHKVFQNCTPGYSLDYTPGKITLIIEAVAAADFGTHICSVSKRHEFSDFTIELSLRPKSVTESPKTNGNQSGSRGSSLFLFSWVLSVCFW